MYYEAEQIPDDIIQRHYNGVEFVNDDFFCNMEVKKWGL